MDNSKIEHFVKSLTELERLQLLSKMSRGLIADFKKMQKAAEAEFQYSGDRKGPRGGKRTTLSAKAQNTTESYQSAVEYFKVFSAEIFKTIIS